MIISIWEGVLTGKQKQITFETMMQHVIFQVYFFSRSMIRCLCKKVIFSHCCFSRFYKLIVFSFKEGVTFFIIFKSQYLVF